MQIPGPCHGPSLSECPRMGLGICILTKTNKQNLGYFLNSLEFGNKWPWILKLKEQAQAGWWTQPGGSWGRHGLQDHENDPQHTYSRGSQSCCTPESPRTLVKADCQASTQTFGIWISRREAWKSMHTFNQALQGILSSGKPGKHRSQILSLGSGYSVFISLLSFLNLQ